MVYLAHAAECCRVQHNQGRLFGLEHPASAISWKQDVSTDLAALPGVYAVTFDQCMIGLKSPSGRPMRKRTRILTISGTMYFKSLIKNKFSEILQIEWNYNIFSHTS